MSIFVEFVVPIPTMREALTAAPEVEAVVDQQTASDDGLRWVVRAWGPAFDGFERGLAADDTVREFELLAEGDERRDYLVVLDATDADRAIYACWSRHGGVFLTGHDEQEGWLFRFRFSAQQFAQQFQECCRREADVSVTLERLHRYEEDEAPFDLSDPQREALAEALHRGYFDVPRGTTLEELAARLGVSDSATSQRIRRGLKAVVEHALSEWTGADRDERDHS